MLLDSLEIKVQVPEGVAICKGLWNKEMMS